MLAERWKHPARRNVEELENREGLDDGEDDLTSAIGREVGVFRLTITTGLFAMIQAHVVL